MARTAFVGGGGVRMYETPEALENKINEYFDYCFVTEWSEKYQRNFKRELQTPTYAGLARYLGFTSRQSFINYENSENPLFEEVIARARLRLEEYLETKLINVKGNPAGIVFAMKNNAGWREENRLEVTGSDSDKPLVFGWAAPPKKVAQAPEATGAIGTTIDISAIKEGVGGTGTPK